MMLKSKSKTALWRVLFLSFTFFGAPVFAESLDEIAAPLTNPVNFEDPRIQSNIRPIYIHHEIDDSFATAGGEVDIFALQLRYAVNDRFALIATKDGYVRFRPNATLSDGDGFANLGLGAKYAFFKNNDSIASAGLRYEAPTGEKEVLQGTGDGIVNPFLSYATSFDALNFIAYTGLRAPIDDEDDSMFYDASLHLDTKLGIFSPLFEMNLYQVLAAGDRLPIADEGQDFFNLGSSLSEGETMLTGAVGTRVALAKNTSIGAAYEFPIVRDSGSYITDWRLTTDIIFGF